MARSRRRIVRARAVSAAEAGGARLNPTKKIGPIAGCIEVYQETTVKNIEKTLKVVKSCMSYEPSEMRELYERAQTLRDRTEPVETQTARLHEAIEIYTKLIEPKDEHIRLYTDRALCYQKLNQYELAGRDHQESVRRHPDNAMAHIFYSEMLYEIDEYQPALEALDQALNIELVLLRPEAELNQKMQW